MPGRQSPVRRTQTEAREEFIERAAELWDSFQGWYKAHPEATFDEIEKVLGQQRREVLGDFLELSLRQGDLGATPEAPRCRQCGRSMIFKGYLSKEVHGLEVDIKIPRAYYYCAPCQAGFFPPGPPSAAEER